MKELKIIFVLTFTALLSGLLLSGIYQSTKPRIIANKQKEIESAVYVVVPGAETYKKISVKGKDLFIVKDKSNIEVGKAFVAAGPGFQDKISIMVGVDNDFKTITGIKIMEQKETPGLGAKIVESFFTDQFKGLNILNGIEVLKGSIAEKDNQVVAITSATISSRAVSAIIDKHIELFRGSIK